MQILVDPALPTPSPPPPAVSCMYEQASVKKLVTRVLGDPSLMLKRFLEIPENFNRRISIHLL